MVELEECTLPDDFILHGHRHAERSESRSVLNPHDQDNSEGRRNFRLLLYTLDISTGLLGTRWLGRLLILFLAHT